MASVATSDWLIRESKRALRSILPQPILNWREIQYYERYGEIELHLVEFLCRPEQDSIDIGAHDGCYIHFMKKYSRQVSAFEPIPWLAKKLVKKFPTDVVHSEIALSNASGKTVLRLPIVDGVLVPGCSSISQRATITYSQFQEIPVRMERLDDIYSGDVGFIKIDIEGHEEAALEGARQTIARCQPRMIVEIDERTAPNGVERISGFFKELNYRGCFINQRRVLPAE